MPSHDDLILAAGLSAAWPVLGLAGGWVPATLLDGEPLVHSAPRAGDAGTYSPPRAGRAITGFIDHG